MGWLVAFFFAICTGLLLLVVLVQADEHRKRAAFLPRPDRRHPGGGPRPEHFHQSAPSEPPDHDWLLAGRYRIVATIGRGGMGVVYRAWDQSTGRYAVIKMPRPDLLIDDQVRERFRRELELTRCLDHPSIVPVLDVGEFLPRSAAGGSGTPFAVMPYLAGGSLHQRKNSRQRDPARTLSSLREWLPDIADALDHVHSRGLLHRDVKPANVLFDGVGKPHLGDFGVAKAVFSLDGFVAELTQTGVALGTPTYMAPECITGAGVEARADQYSLAVMVFEQVAGRPPFTASTPAALLLQQASAEAPLLDTVRPDLPRSLAAAVNRGLHKSPEERFGSCRAFVEAALVDVGTPHRPKPPKLMCPDCGKLLTTRHQWAGRTGRCPKCHATVEIGQDLQSLWLRRDRDPVPRPRRERGTTRQSGLIAWIDQHGLLVTLAFGSTLLAWAAISWSPAPLLALAASGAAVGAWQVMRGLPALRQGPRPAIAPLDEAAAPDDSGR